jgi:hypothetical protein
MILGASLEVALSVAEGVPMAEPPLAQHHELWVTVATIGPIVAAAHLVIFSQSISDIRVAWTRSRSGLIRLADVAHLITALASIAIGVYGSFAASAVTAAGLDCLTVSKDIHDPRYIAGLLDIALYLIPIQGIVLLILRGYGQVIDWFGDTVGLHMSYLWLRLKKRSYRGRPGAHIRYLERRRSHQRTYVRELHSALDPKPTPLPALIRSQQRLLAAISAELRQLNPHRPLPQDHLG